LNEVGMNWVGPKAPAHEPLRWSGRTSPRARDFQRREKLLAEIILAPADAGQLRGRTDHRAVADHRAVVGLHAPDRGDDGAVDPVGLLDCVERRAVLRQDGAAVGDALLADEEVEIVPERLGEFGLAVEQVHNAQVGHQPCDIGVEHRAADPAALGLRPEPLEAAAEISRSRADRLRRHQRMIGRA
jgi:hypothetical protein